MDAKTALLVALGVAVGLPYVTVALIRSGSAGVYLVGALFVGVFLLVIESDRRSGESVSEPAEEDDG